MLSSFRFSPMRFVVVVLAFLLAVPVFADAEVEPEKDENARWFSLSLRYEIAVWAPWQYQADQDLRLRSYHVGNLVGNGFEMMPFVLSTGTKSGLGFEFAYEMFIMRDWGYQVVDFTSGRAQPSTVQGRELHRNEGHLLALLPISGGDHALTARFGIQRLETFSGEGNMARSSYVKVPAWGLRAGMKYAFDPTGMFSPWIKTDVFWAKGERIFRASSADQYLSGPYITAAWGSASTKGEWFGFETLIGLSWNITQNVSLDVAYHREIAFFRYVNYYVSALPLSDQMAANTYHEWNNNEYDIRGMNTKRDTIGGWSLGLTAKVDGM